MFKLDFIDRKRIFIVAVIVFILTAYNSHGYYHGDEHFQIIEFSGLKLGTHSNNDLAWEFEKQIRPSLQPSICYLVIKTSSFVGIKNPYSQILILRILTAFLALFTLNLFLKRTEFLIRNEFVKKIYHIASYFIWFVPFLNVRFSSETWSSLLFLMALATFFKKNDTKNNFYKIGIFLGLSFLFRFQVSFAILGFVAWLAIINKTNIKKLLKISISFSLIVLFGFLIDSWFYGNVVFVPWKYFYVNIIENVASNFGMQPWYYYLVKFILSMGFFTSIPLLLSILILIYRKPKNLFIWCILPYIIVHTIIPHKEERFLFFILYFTPIIATLVFQLYQEKLSSKTISLYLYLLFGINLIGIIAMTQKSAGNGKMEITKYIYDHYPTDPVNLIHTKGSNPFDPWGSVKSKFYEQKNIQYSNIIELNNLTVNNTLNDKVNLLIIEKSDLQNKNMKEQLANMGFVELHRSVPAWIDYLNDRYRRFYKKLNNTLILFHYSKEENRE